MSDTPDRRRSVRIATHGPVDVELLSSGVRLALLDVGEGGCLVSSSRHLLASGPVQLFFSTSDRTLSVTLTASLVHAHLRTVPGRRPVEWVTGFAFHGTTDAEVRDAIVRLIAAATAGPATPPPPNPIRRRT